MAFFGWSSETQHMLSDEIKDSQIWKSASKSWVQVTLFYRRGNSGPEEGRVIPKASGSPPPHSIRGPRTLWEIGRQKSVPTDTDDTQVWCLHRHITHRDTQFFKMDSASKITLNFLSVVLLSFIKLAILYKYIRRPKYVIQCFTAQRVSIRAHLRTKDFEKFWEILALLYCFRNRRPKARAWCGSRSFTDVTRKARKLSKSLFSGLGLWSGALLEITAGDCLLFRLGFILTILWSFS